MEREPLPTLAHTGASSHGRVGAVLLVAMVSLLPLLLGLEPEEEPPPPRTPSGWFAGWLEDPEEARVAWEAAVLEARSQRLAHGALWALWACGVLAALWLSFFNAVGAAGTDASTRRRQSPEN